VLGVEIGTKLIGWGLLYVVPRVQTKRMKRSKSYKGKNCNFCQPKKKCSLTWGCRRSLKLQTHIVGGLTKKKIGIQPLKEISVGSDKAPELKAFREKKKGKKGMGNPFP